MANIIVDNPEACPFPEYRERQSVDGSCEACYWSHVENGQWCGSQVCWNAGCIQYGGLDKQE